MSTDRVIKVLNRVLSRKPINTPVSELAEVIDKIITKHNNRG